jgi:hypothetical protein
MKIPKAVAHPIRSAKLLFRHLYVSWNYAMDLQHFRALKYQNMLTERERRCWVGRLEAWETSLEAVRFEWRHL